MEGWLRGRGVRTRRLASFLARREKTLPAKRPELDRKASGRLFRPQAVVFSDTADFTIRVARDGILHFLMVFERLVRGARTVVRSAGGELVKVEADSLLLRFENVPAACRGVAALEGHLRRLNRALPPSERLRFSYGIGYGNVLNLEHDLFGLEVNLASRLGEDLAEPGDVLLTPAAAAAAGPLARRLVPQGRVRFGRRVVKVSRLRSLPSDGKHKHTTEAKATT